MRQQYMLPGNVVWGIHLPNGLDVSYWRRRGDGFKC